MPDNVIVLAGNKLTVVIIVLSQPSIVSRWAVKTPASAVSQVLDCTNVVSDNAKVTVVTTRLSQPYILVRF